MPELLPLLSYLFVMCITPGPNNVLLAASGANHGLRRTLPQIAGITLGNGLQLLVCALFLSSITDWIEQARWPLTLAGCSYLLWMALALARASGPGAATVSQPIGLASALLFQNINPKAWIMVANTAILFMPPEGGARAALALMGAGLLVGVPSCLFWAWGGDALRQRLRDPRALQAFNATAAALLVMTVAWLIHTEWQALP